VGQDTRELQTRAPASRSRGHLEGRPHYTFKLRPNRDVSRRTPFNAEAVKSSSTPANEQGSLLRDGTYPYVKGFLGNVAGVEVLDASTVQIRLKARSRHSCNIWRTSRSSCSAPSR